MNLILEEKEVPAPILKRAIRKATLSAQYFPVVCGTSFKNKCVKLMLNAVVDYLPSPVDIPPMKAYQGEKEISIPASDDEYFSSLAFKVMNDPYVGNLTYFRVYSGILTKGSYVYNSTKGERERIGRIILMHANSRTDIDEVRTGDIAAAVGLKATTTGDTLIDEKHKDVVLENMVFPEPVINQALEPASKDASEKLSISLQKLAAEDPTFKY
ncbi:elongation factor G [Chlamydia abortus]|nr:elongation factor G [Chlamydia abortus]